MKPNWFSVASAIDPLFETKNIVDCLIFHPKKWVSSKSELGNEASGVVRRRREGQRSEADGKQHQEAWQTFETPLGNHCSALDGSHPLSPHPEVAIERFDSKSK